MKKNNILISIIILLTIILILLGVYIIGDYNKQQVEYIKIDEYNFKQLEKAKPILDSIKQDDKIFYTLKEFNNIYNANIKPIENCYYVSNSNGSENYIFGFKLKSDKYVKEYGKDYYVFPRYDLPVDYICGGGKKCDYDIIFGTFYKTISNPCKD